MNDKIAKATMSEVNASLQTAKEALSTRDTSLATAAIDRAITATGSLIGEARNAQRTSRPRSPQRRKRASSGEGSSNGSRRGRVPIEQRREHVVNALRESGRPMSTAEIAKAVGTTPSNARTVIGKMDDDLLEVVKAKGTEPARFDLRERVGAQT